MWSSCSTSHWKCEYKLKINWKRKFRRSRPKKLTFPQIFKFFTFFGSVVPPLFGFSTSIKPIDVKILPASIYSRSSSIRKWIQIEIWADGGSFNFEFKSLTSSICCRPHFSNFSCHRITLRVWMWSSCSTSHWKCEYKLKIDWKSKFRRSWAKKLTFPEIFNFFIFFGSEVPPSFGFSTSIKPIDVKVLPASIYSRSSSIRIWIQIEI